MKRAEHFAAVLISAMLLACVLCMGASAKYEPIAEELAMFGMFRGTSKGFELDRAPTRAEAAIMLVRLYNAEEEAIANYAAGQIAHPFTDVSQYTSPYVAWLYERDLTRGISEHTFGSQRPCSMRNYVVFLLRALGYEDGTDFQYADALSFAEMAGVKNSDLSTDSFLRDDMVLLTCRGLSARLKGEESPFGKYLMQVVTEGRTDYQSWTGLQRYVDASMSEKDELPNYALSREESAMSRWKGMITGSSISYLCRNPEPDDSFTALPDYAVTLLPDGWTLAELDKSGYGIPVEYNYFSEWEYASGDVGEDTGRIVFRCQNPVSTSPVYGYPVQNGRFVDIQGTRGELYTGILSGEYAGETSRRTYSLLFWETEDGKLCTLFGRNVEEKDLLEMAESVQSYDGKPLNLKAGWTPRGYVEKDRISAAGSFQVEWNHQGDRLILLASPNPIQTPDHRPEIIEGYDGQPDLAFRSPMLGSSDEREESRPSVTVNGEEVDASEPVNVGGATVTAGTIIGWQWMNTLTWEEDGVHYQLRGLLERDKLVQIARSMR